MDAVTLMSLYYLSEEILAWEDWAVNELPLNYSLQPNPQTLLSKPICISHICLLNQFGLILLPGVAI
jgi:hypothetical protein